MKEKKITRQVYIDGGVFEALQKFLFEKGYKFSPLVEDILKRILIKEGYYTQPEMNKPKSVEVPKAADDEILN